MMRSRSIWFVAVVAGLCLTADLARAGEAGEVIPGDVLVGVDHLGRVLVAVDQKPSDGLVDHCFLFTSEERLGGPWSRRVEGRVVVTVDSLSVRSPFVVVSVALIGTDPRPPHYPPGAEVFIDHNGLELSRIDAPPTGGAPLDGMDIEDLSTWPEAFWYDVHDPASCVGGGNCISGGPGSTSCSLTLGPVSCSVTCTGDTFACCSETSTGGVRCRCVPCSEGPGGPPQVP